MSYTEIKTPKATFRLLHRRPGKKSFARDWPAKTDAVLVELVQSPPIKEVNERIEAYIDELEDNPAFETLVEKAKKQGFRICFGDLAESKGISSSRDLGWMLLELLVSFLITGYGIELIWRKNLPFFGLVLLVVGVWLLSSAIDVLGYFLTKEAGNTASNRFLRIIREITAQASNIHPEETVLFLRNLVIAEKAWEIAELECEKNQRCPPTVVLDFHFGHAGILKMLKWKPQTRRRLFRLYRPLMKGILKDPVRRDYLVRIIVMAWKGEKWEVRRNYLVDSLGAVFS